MRSRDEMRDQLAGWLDAAADAFDGLPDGAWHEAMVGAVREFNRRNRTTFDPDKEVANLRSER